MSPANWGPDHPRWPWYSEPLSAPASAPVPLPASAGVDAGALPLPPGSPEEPTVHEAVGDGLDHLDPEDILRERRLDTPSPEASSNVVAPGGASLVAAADAAGIRPTPGAASGWREAVRELEDRHEALVKATHAGITTLEQQVAELSAMCERNAQCGATDRERLDGLYEWVDAQDGRLNALAQSIRATGARVSAAQDDAEVIALRERLRCVAFLMEHQHSGIDCIQAIARGEHLKGGE